MTEQDRLLFAQMLYALAEAFNEQVTELRAEAYFDALADLPLEGVVAAGRRALREARFFPKPVELRELVGGSVEDRAELAWIAVLRLIRKFGYWRAPKDSDWPDLAAKRAALELFGGWRALCSNLPIGGPELLGHAKNFKATYRAYDGLNHRLELVERAAGQNNGALAERAEERDEQ